MVDEEFWRKLKEIAEEHLVKKEISIPDHIRWLNIHYDNGCNHNWKYNGHGHNYTCYKCSKCGTEGEY